MDVPATARPTRPLADRRFQAVVWLLAGVVGWAGVALLGAALQASDPPALGFDLELVLAAGRRVAAGQSPYDPAAVAAGLQAQDLFYSYPPPLGQAFALVAALPSTAVLAAFGALAVAAFAAVAVRIARGFGVRAPAASVVVPLVGILPFLYPMTVALLFGNVDAWYPALFGLLLLAVLPGASGTALVGGGAALAIVSVAKVHPASLGLWLLVRAHRDPRARLVVAAAIVAGLAIVGLSLAFGGLGPWQDYLAVVRSISGADLVLRNNTGPAAQVALLTGAGESGARTLHLVVAAAAILATLAAAWRLSDSVLSLAIAAVASLVVLPVSWFHYPVAVLPFAVAAWARANGTPSRGRVGALLAIAGVVAALSITLPVAVWISVGLVLVAVGESGRVAREPDALRGTETEGEAGNADAA